MSIKIALAGNPNCGKTTLFNALTGSNQFVGNWPGVTVEKKEGKLKGHKDVILMDLPGIYSLSPYTLEEVVARNYLITDKPDAILNIIDGTNLERNLYLSTQLMELGIPVVMAVNMMDIVKKNGDQIDVKSLGKKLGCEVVEISALKGTGIKDAAAKVVEIAKSNKETQAVHEFHDDLENAITDKTKAVVLNTPNNPTGMLYTEEELRAIAKVVVEKDIYVVADEMYENLVYGEQKHISIASFGKDIYDRTITCSGLAKSYAMTGWRIGYTGSSKEIAKMMGSVQSHQTSNPNSIAQKAAVEALTGPQDSVAKMHAEFDKRRKYMYERICKMPLVSTIEPMGAFYVFVDASEVLGKKYKDTVVESVAQMAEILINDYNTAVVPCADFGFEKHLRLSYAISIEQIEKGLDRIESFLNDLK